MALWHFLVRNARGLWVPEAAWDDGDKCRPGDAGFDPAAARAKAGDRLLNYVGTPNWQSQEA